MKQQNPTSISRRFEQINNIFYLMVGLPLLGFAWIYLNLDTLEAWKAFEHSSFGPILNIIIVAGVLISIFLAFKKFRKSISAYDFSTPGTGDLQQIREKADIFLNASARFYGLLTMGTVLVLIGFYFSAQLFYAALYSALLIIFSLKRPTEDRLIRNMRFNKEERKILFDELKRREG